MIEIFRVRQDAVQGVMSKYEQRRCASSDVKRRSACGVASLCSWWNVGVDCIVGGGDRDRCTRPFRLRRIPQFWEMACSCTDP